ncbi:chorismate transformation enzyme, FkbO/Hyg5 family [Variovorax sp. PAMC 28711]|uniref:chorismate transformation enzyme, FkbO/Hyg5 family n=1 Tax=Variovorax sp. PAMC 28711 TaxID=1795631 RepID=UPI001F1CFB99|nr:Rid family hydrolase [Variovorax sp. PAMC 28711]
MTASCLRVERVSLVDGVRLAAREPAPLAALCYGQVPGAPPWLSTVDTRVLGAGDPVVDFWHGNTHAEITVGSTGAVNWRSDGTWLWGSIELDETKADARDLGELAERAYRDLFRTLDAVRIPHLLRIWNYLPQINADGGGLERYRQFNQGRQQAFVDAGQAAFDGAPAACALGVREGGLCIRFLAGRQAPVPVENPRQVSAYRYPDTYGPRAPTFSRAALADVGDEVALFVSGTASIVGHETLHAGDVHAQTRETLRNLDALVAAANATGGTRFSVDALDCVVYVRHPHDVAAVMSVIDEVVGAPSRFVRHAVVLQADICRSDLLVEIEAHAFAPGRLHA